MPKVLADFLGYIFFFWFNEEDRPHVHVCKGKPSHTSAKFWVTPDGATLANNDAAIPQSDLRKIEAYIQANRDQILLAWMRHFDG